MRIQIAQGATSLLARRREELMHDASLPLSVRGSANVHFEKPWIPNFWSVAIRAPAYTSCAPEASTPSTRGSRRSVSVTDA